MKNKKQSEIVVFGDVMLDEYFWGTVDRISPEAPIPVVNLRAFFRIVFLSEVSLFQ